SREGVRAGTDSTAVGKKQRAGRAGCVVGAAQDRATAADRRRTGTAEFLHRLTLAGQPETHECEPCHTDNQPENRHNHDDLKEREPARAHPRGADHARSRHGRIEYTACNNAAATNATSPPNATISAGSTNVTSVFRPRSASCAARSPARRAMSASRPLDSPTWTS